MSKEDDLELAEIRKLRKYLEELGLIDLPQKIEDEHFMRRVLEARIAYDYHSLQSEIWRDRAANNLDDIIAIQAALYDKAASYNNVVTTLGYAGFFAIWNLVAESLDSTENAFIGLFLGASLLVFICWTLMVGTITSLNIRQYALIAGKDYETYQEHLDAHAAAEQKINRAGLSLQRFWPPVFIFSSMAALIPGLYLLAELLHQIGGVELNLVSSFADWLKDK